jgi:hypothetical protein
MISKNSVTLMVGEDIEIFILNSAFLSKDVTLFFGVEIEKSIYYKRVLSIVPFLSLK